MVAPIDYSLNVQSPFEAAISGFKMGAGLAEIQARREAAQAESMLMQQKQQSAMLAQEETNRLYSNPNPRAADFARVSSLLPKDQAENMRKSWEILSEEKKQNRLLQSGQVFSALKANAPDIAIKLLEEQAIANRNSGEEAQAKAAETYIDIIKVDPKRAYDNIGTMLATIPGGEKIIESAAKSAEMRRAEELAPITMREKTADVVSKELENKFKPEKLAADLGLTRAQTEQAKAAVAASRAAAAKSGAEAARAQAEARQMGAGIIPLEKRPEMEAKFRKEYSDQTKGYTEVKEAYQRILVSQPNPAGDLSLIFGYMKLLDPMTGVREGEYANAANAAGIPERIRIAYNKALDGDKLSADQRKMYKAQADKLYTAAAVREKEVRKGIERIATGYGLKTENIFYTPTEVAPTAPSTAQPAPQAATPAMPQGFRVIR
jgi:hypothetical protein